MSSGLNQHVKGKRTMDKDLLALIDKSVPKMNPKLSEGFTYHESSNFEPYIDNILREASHSLERFGIKYHGYQIVSPKERLSEETRPRKSRRTYETGKSDFYMIRVDLRLNGKKLRTRYLYIPFIRPGGLMFIKDVKYLIVPTLENVLFSIEDGSVFLPVSRARVTFRRSPYYFLADGKQVNTDIYWSKIHHNTTNEAPKARLPQLFNYILADQGLTKAFKVYFDIDIAYGKQEDMTVENYPSTDWVLCETLGISPRSMLGPYVRTDVVLAIPRDKYEDKTMYSLIASFFYILDVCSSQSFFKMEEFESPFLWKRVLSRFIWNKIDDRDAIMQVDEHIISIRDYIDNIVQMKLKKEGIDVENILELFQYMICNFSKLTVNNDVAALHNKRLEITSKIMYPAVSMIFNIVFQILRMKKDRLTVEKLNQFLDKNWFPQIIQTISSESKWVQVLESTTDQMIYKVSSQVHIDSKVSGKTKSEEMTDPSFKLHPDMLTVCSWNYVNKASPSARGRLNPFMALDSFNKPIPRPEHDEYREEFVRLS